MAGRERRRRRGGSHFLSTVRSQISDLNNYWFNDKYYYLEPKDEQDENYEDLFDDIMEGFGQLVNSALPILESFGDEINSKISSQDWSTDSKSNEIIHTTNAAWKTIFDLLNSRNTTDTPSEEYKLFVLLLKNAHKFFINRNLRWLNVRDAKYTNLCPNVSNNPCCVAQCCSVVLPDPLTHNGPPISKNGVDFRDISDKLQRLHDSIQEHFSTSLEGYIKDGPKLEKVDQAKLLWEWGSRCVNIFTVVTNFDTVDTVMSEMEIERGVGAVFQLAVRDVLNNANLGDVKVDTKSGPNANMKPDISWFLKTLDSSIDPICLGVMELKKPALSNLSQDDGSGWVVVDDSSFGGIVRELVYDGFEYGQTDNLFLSDGCNTIMVQIFLQSRNKPRIDGEIAYCDKEYMKLTMLVNGELESPKKFTLQGLLIARMFGDCELAKIERGRLSLSELQKLLSWTIEQSIQERTRFFRLRGESSTQVSESHPQTGSSPRDSEFMCLYDTIEIKKPGEAYKNSKTIREEILFGMFTETTAFMHLFGKLEYLQFGPYNCQVMKITMSNCKKIFRRDLKIEGKGPDDYVVLKIYNLGTYVNAYKGYEDDYLNAAMFGSCDEFVDYMRDHYKDELRTFEMIQNYEKDHGALAVPKCYLTGYIDLYKQSMPYFSGEYLLMDYIEPDPELTERYLKSDEDFQDDFIQSQLNVLLQAFHEMGIDYSDIRKENCIITKDKKLHLIDFSHVKFIGDKVQVKKVRKLAKQ